MGDAARYTTRLLSSATWDDFAELVEANNGVWGGCWCMAFHADGFQGGREANRSAKRELVDRGIHQLLVYEGERAVGWCQFGPPSEIVQIKNRKVYEKELDRAPDWRIGCIFTGSRHRGRGVARTAVAGALAAIADAGGGLVEAYPEQEDGRPPQRGAYFQTGPESLYAGFGFTRVRRIAKWRWVMRLEVPA
ncbi:MAG: GNAT family N-acetyltransferase [Leifsonia xyli]|nr:MAG: GNAT family N-acetyltransferase [Leifsonia xyli]